eukprot:CAMPEP_0119514742 /NCGR_PEP_ID=MMETSP1344-20130328/32471_1 /TAXON_ID=236787 /ORGANISM="Florenciella parvula, Strain CCMP2471" /LENGTH=31 /DNA_ID= /DNA_START= /DNA_END= /DNA_ORIENTATION=
MKQSPPDEPVRALGGLAVAVRMLLLHADTPL